MLTGYSWSITPHKHQLIRRTLTTPVHVLKLITEVLKLITDLGASRASRREFGKVTQCYDVRRTFILDHAKKKTNVGKKERII